AAGGDRLRIGRAGAGCRVFRSVVVERTDVAVRGRRRGNVCWRLKSARLKVTSEQVDLRPLTESDGELLSSLEQQEDVWEFIGALPLPDEEHLHHLFAIVEGQARRGVGGLV